MSDDSPRAPLAFRDVITAIYADLGRDVASAGPVCELSGRCCRFAEYGHTLFLSAAELAFLLEDAPPAVRPVDEGATCPWQDERGRCTAREARPLGCRVYYCDEGYQDLAHALSEQYIARLKRLSEEYALPWDYAPLHWHLKRAAERGDLPQFEPGPDPSGARRADT
jgi:Fe-S-cluster containining protein